MVKGINSDIVNNTPTTLEEIPYLNMFREGIARATDRTLPVDNMVRQDNLGMFLTLPNVSKQLLNLNTTVFDEMILIQSSHRYLLL